MDDGEDPPHKNNILSFPKTVIKATHGMPELVSYEHSIDHDHYVRTRKAVYRCIEDLMENIENDDEIVGVVCLSFNKDNTMKDVMAGDISATNLYVMLDKVKMEVMDIISDTMEE